MTGADGGGAGWRNREAKERNHRHPDRGGDVSGLNPAIRAFTIWAIREGFRVIGLRRGWKGVVSCIRDRKYHQEDCFQMLTEEIVNRVGRTGGTFLHTSRTRPSHIPREEVPGSARITRASNPSPCSS